jgi:hypothetical protein
MNKTKLKSWRDYSVAANAILLTTLLFQQVTPSFGNIFMLNLGSAISLVLFFGAVDFLILKFFKNVTKGNIYEQQILSQILLFVTIIIGITWFI